MSDPISTEALKVLDSCKAIELLSEQLYRSFALLFADDRDLAALWHKTANEEANHAQQFEMAMRMKHAILESVDVEAKGVTDTLKYVHSVVDFARENPPTAFDALHLSVQLEQRLAKLHFGCIAVFKDESVKDLFRAMMTNDNRHVESILEARESYAQPH